MKTLWSILLWIYYGICILFFFILILLTFLITMPFDRYRRKPNLILRGLAYSMIKPIPGWKVRIQGTERFTGDRPTLFVANHQSFLDMPLIYLLPWRMKWVAKRSLFRIPVFGWLIAMTGHIGIDRTSRRSVKKLQQIVQPIRQGIPGMIFPEGTRSEDGSLKRFKTGAFKLARDHNFLIHPLVLNGGSNALPPGDWKLELNQTFTISVLDPVDPAQFNTINELKEHVHGVIQRELEIIRKQAAGHP